MFDPLAQYPMVSLNQSVKEMLNVKEMTNLDCFLLVKALNHKNYNFLNCDWFKNSYFPLIHLPSCYRTVCYRTVQQTNHIQSCSLNQPITFKVVV